ncbi:MAG: 4-phosphoerythronate dehydrogenase [Gammaproteobacteria bacterium]|nr:4-phosphoerythronate dehydrogenase [Gammaproteobacteria bacterium]MBU2058865.1 4-phosphoerythronate dehydrogenase [Gammaproteobacteria bacterium]MBU2177072.1 4-phosphoerythronate dehydrogenase [Gammaproteobacteria bacterium]MBU2247058.1 4-phosphoerythronate dehydrogenase [Gammaproteobacteria bacterium]MBU2345336.1 4-phosphoerythronate dehydrogenase [Gammaproteobacteria bacterium]
MKIYADENMPYVKDFFADLGNVTLVNGRTLTSEQIIDADVLLVRSVTKVNAQLLAQSPGLKFVGTATIGTDHVDQSYLQQRGIGFSSAPGCNAQSVVEYVLSSIFVLSEKYQWNLQHKTVGVVGVGNIGRLLVSALQALSIKVLCCDPLRADAEPDFAHIPFEELLPQLDIVSFHVPLVKTGPDATVDLLNAQSLKLLKPECAVINACRGEVTNNNALLNEAQSGHKRALVLDVWANEPEPDVRLIPFADIATAHIAGHSIEGKARGTEMLYQALCLQLGVTPAKTLAQVLPAAQVSEVKINSSFGLLDVQNLTRLLYDVRRDDALFRFYMMQDKKTQGFDWLRKSYPPRREYSSVQLTGQEVPEFLTTLGFSGQ